MRIFVAGATGAIGRRLVPKLVASGHEVVGMTRSPERADALVLEGAEPVVGDALDRDALIEVVRQAEPDVVVHQATALSGMSNVRRFEQEFAETNRLRTDGIDNLIAAARAAGARAFVAQSFAGWPFARKGGPVKTEEDPLDPTPPAAFRRTIDAIRHLEDAVTGLRDMDGLVLRYGGFYGPGTSLGEGGAHVEAVRRGRFPVVGDGGGIWSFLHVEDAAEATLAAIGRGATGIYNVVDDEPAPVREWLPFLAEAVGGPRPKHVPAWLARFLIGEHGVVMMTDGRGASNAKAKRELGWTPAYPTWRTGFVRGLADRGPSPKAERSAT